MNRNILAYVLPVIAVLILVIPIFFILPNIYFQTPTDYLFTIHRGLGLYAFSLIFLQILIGSNRVYLGTIYPFNRVLNVHMTLGKIAFTLALLHPVLLYSTYITEHNMGYVIPFLIGTNIWYFLLGVTGLVILIATVTAALLRLRIGPKWIHIHRFNYLIFWIIFIHSWFLGVDVQSLFAHGLYTVYAILIAFFTIKRFKRGY